MRQFGQDPVQVLFRDILFRLRDAKLTISDWEQLMKHTPAEVGDHSQMFFIFTPQLKLLWNIMSPDFMQVATQ